jgi:hypothetical protein
MTATLDPIRCGHLDCAAPDSNGYAAPEFAKMTTAEKVVYQRQRWQRILG